jgi:hypothetical protein
LSEFEQRNKRTKKSKKFTQILISREAHLFFSLQFFFFLFYTDFTVLSHPFFPSFYFLLALGHASKGVKENVDLDPIRD